MTSPFLACLCALLVLSQISSGWAVPLSRQARKAAKSCDRSVDVAIIGAGPSGTYSAYRLRDAGLDIELFEYSDRIGGRLYTSTLPNIPDLNLELGGMRFIDGVHTRVQKVVAELGLTPKVFTEGFGKSGRTKFYLRGKSLTHDDLKSGDVPYSLSPEEKKNQGHLVSYYLEQLTGYSGGDLPREETMRLRLKDGTPLYKLTYDEALDLVATQEGKAFVSDTNIFESEVLPDTCAVNVFMEHLGEYAADGEVYTLKEGLSSLPRTLAEKFEQASTDHKVTMNRQLRSIRNGMSNPYVLSFDETRSDNGYTESLGPLETVCANKVILAIPQYALSRLDWVPLTQVRTKQALNAVAPMPASKVFMTFSEAWWLGTDAANAVPVTKSQSAFSQMYDWSHSNQTGDFAMIASYADVSKTLHLQDINQGDDLIPGSAPGFNRVTKKLKDEVLDHLAEAFGIDRALVPEPVSAVSQWWTSYPFGGGWTAWVPGFNFNDVKDTIRRPSLAQDIFVVGADHAFGTTNPWIEGAFETVDDVFDAYF